MKCNDCDCELIELGKLTDEEQINYDYLIVQEEVANKAVSNNYGVNFTKFKDEQILEYFKASYDYMAKFRTMHYCFFRDLAKRFELENWDLRIIDGVVYNHP